MFWRAWVLLFTALWMLVAPFVLRAGQAQTYSQVLTGIVIAAVAIWTLLTAPGGAKPERVRKAA